MVIPEEAKTDIYKAFKKWFNKRKPVYKYILIVFMGVVVCTYFLGPKLWQSWKNRAVQFDENTQFARILVLQIEGDTPNNDVQRKLVSSLNSSVSQIASSGPPPLIEILPFNKRVSERNGLQQAHEAARQYGKQQFADVVIWGNCGISPKEFYPRITLVDDSEQKIIRSNKTLLVQDISEFSLPSVLVDSPVALAHFGLGLALYKRKAYKTALIQFQNILEFTFEKDSLFNDVRCGAAFFAGRVHDGLMQYAESIACLQLAHALNPDDTRILSYYAISLFAAARYAEAEPFYRRALEIVEKQLGEEHPHVATGLNNLALLLQAKGDLTAAEPLYRRALAILKEKLGATHPNTQAAQRNLQQLLEEMKGKH